MFEDSLVESSGRIQTKRRLPTFISAAVQMLLLGVLVLIPLIHTEGLPKAQMFTCVLRPDRQSPPPPPPAGAVKVIQVETEIDSISSLAPTTIPKKIETVNEDEAPTKIRVSPCIVASNKISGPNPQYPLIAKIDRIKGQVVLEATISKHGTIENLRPVSGPPMLYQSAIDAVRQWRYKPYTPNGEAVEVETTIQVNFTLN